MAQVKLLKIASDGVPLEFNSTLDDITLNSFTAGAGPVMSPTGIDMNGTDVIDLSDLVFTDPSVGTVNQTAGSLIIDNLMAKERNNVMTTAGAILFPLITDTAAQVDSLKIPHIAGAPTATPAFSSAAGYMVYDDTNNKLYIWDGVAWDDQSTVTAAQAVQNLYTAGEDIDVTEAVYISGSDEVSLASGADGTAPSRLMGFAVSSVLDTQTLYVQSEGVLDGFTGLTPGSRYYLSPATPGAITATTPVGTGNTVVQAGYSKNATALHIHIEQLGRRA